MAYLLAAAHWLILVRLWYTTRSMHETFPL